MYSTNAASLLSARDKHYFTKPIVKYIRRMLNAAHYGFDLTVKDDASGNNAACAVDRTMPKAPGVMQDAIDCQSHQNQPTSVDSSVAVFGMPILQSVHSVASFYNYGTHRLRLAQECIKTSSTQMFLY